jgi:tetratricopeptide (TPR) repeat protein
MKLAAFVVLCSLAAAGGLAQEDPHAACSHMGWVPRAILERPAPLRAGTGNAHEAVTTSSKEAQALYDQGLNYLHGYVWIEAARSFNAALRLDPGLAMAWVGLSRVYSGLDDPPAAQQALARAQEVGAKASERERRRIAVRAKQLEALADLGNPVKHAEYKRAIDDALAVDVDDIELWLLRGNSEEPTAAGRGQRGGAASTAFYGEALRRSADNAAAHHYLIHSYETIGQIPLALEHGEAYARLAPAIPHSHHMWAHDLRRVGRIDDAIAAFRRADELEKAYYAGEGIPASLDWHHIHNLDLLATSYQHKGQMKKAEETLREAAAVPSLTEYAAFSGKAFAYFLLSRGRAREALDAGAALAGAKWASARAIGQAIRGHALLASGRRAEAREALTAADREMATLPQLVGGIGISRTAVQPYVDTLRGEILLRRDRPAEGRALLQQVEQSLRALPGPDAWIQSLFRLEAIGRTAREVGDWELADYTARQMMDHDSAYGGSRLAAALVARQRGDAAAAAREFGAAEGYWRDADADLPELAEARKSGRASVGAPP